MTEAALAPVQQARFDQFLSRLAAITGADLTEAEILDRAGAALAALVAYDDWLEDEFAACDPAGYRQYLLHCDPRRRYCVVSFVWGPGQETPIHDHTTWGAVGVLRGAEISQSYELHDGRPRLTGELRLGPGEVAFVGPSVGDIHRVRNAYDDRPSISIHVYGDDIGQVERHAFSEDGKVKTFVSAYSNRSPPREQERL